MKTFDNRNNRKTEEDHSLNQLGIKSDLAEEVHQLVIKDKQIRDNDEFVYNEMKKSKLY